MQQTLSPNTVSYPVLNQEGFQWLINSGKLASSYARLRKHFQVPIKFSRCSMCTWKEHVFYFCQLECSIGICQVYCFRLLFKFTSFFIFFILSIIESGVLKAPTITVESYISHSSSIRVFFFFMFLRICCQMHPPLFSHSVVSDSLRTYGLQPARLVR